MHVLITNLDMKTGVISTYKPEPMDDIQKIEDDIIKSNAVEERMKNLSKAKIDAEAKALEMDKFRQEAEAKAIAAEKERDFFKGFSIQSSKYPGANDYQDKILEKFHSGYDIEDATISVLAKEGKLTPQVQRQSPAGGSASNQISQGGSKTLSEMTREEKRQAILEAEAKGDISNN